MRTDSRLLPWAFACFLVCGPGTFAADTTPAPRTPSRTSLLFNKPAGTLTLSPPARPEVRKPFLGEPYVATGFIKKELTSTATGQPHVTEGVLKIETDARGKTAASAAAPVAPKGQPNLSKRIEQACGRAAQQVEVVQESPTSYRVCFTVRNFGDAEKVSRQVLKIPELLTCSVSFEVHVQQ